VNTLKKLALGLLASLVVLLCPTFAQQNYLTQTYLSAALAEPASPGTPPVPQSNVQVNSATGITAPSFNSTGTINTQTQWQIYVDRELMTVVGVNGSNLTVLRGQGGTRATGHASGAMVLAGHPNWFYVADPGGISVQGITAPSSAPCVLSNVVVSPWVNIRTGLQWVCNPTSGVLTWQAGFGNPYNLYDDSMATVSSVAGATNISFPMITISGTNAITSFTFTGNGAIGVAGAATANQAISNFCVIPTGAFTTVVGNNIGSAQTAVVGQIMCWYWNGKNGTWLTH
jgi:hypothetical protein